MIHGLDKFRERFAGLERQYVLIGGTATYLALESAGLDPRATKDLDIVLCLEALDAAFGAAFWAFVKEGGYDNIQQSTGDRIFYRFAKPKDNAFPAMLELFSAAPDGLKPPADVTITRITIDDDIYSLSAILMEGGYYEVLQAHRTVQDGLSVLNERGLIPLKAKAWLDLTKRKAGGESIDSKNITKHRGDILRLYRLLRPDERITLPAEVMADMGAFLAELEKAGDLDLKVFGLGASRLQDVVTTLKQVYQVT